MITVLVTGATGFIGGRLAAHFERRGARVVVDAAGGAGPARAGRGRLDAATLAHAVGGAVPDVVFHAAGSGTVAQVAADPARELAANLSALLAVLEFARSSAPRARVVLLSSAALYGDAPAAPQREDDARDPVSLYGVAKAQAEQLAAFYSRRHGVTATAVRLFSVYGPGLRKQLLWDAMTKFAAGRGEFFGSGRERRDWVHVDDVCAFMTRLAEAPPRAPYEVYNCAAGVAANTAEVLTHLAALAGAAPPRFNGQTRAGDPDCLLADCGKAERELGWRAQTAWRDGVAAYALWYSAQAGTAGAPR